MGTCVEGRERLCEPSHQCIVVGKRTQVESREEGRTEEPRQPLVEHLKFLVRGADDEANEVHFGAEGEDEGETT